MTAVSGPVNGDSGSNLGTAPPPGYPPLPPGYTLTQPLLGDREVQLSAPSDQKDAAPLAESPSVAVTTVSTDKIIAWSVLIRLLHGQY